MKSVFCLLALGSLAACASAQPVKPPASSAQIGIMVAFKDGVIIAAQVMGGADNLIDCQKALTAVIAQEAPKFPELVLVPVCTPAPNAPQTHPSVSQSRIPVAPVERL